MRRSCNSDGEAGGVILLVLKNSDHGLAVVHNVEIWTRAVSVCGVSDGIDFDNDDERALRAVSDCIRLNGFFEFGTCAGCTGGDVLSMLACSSLTLRKCGRETCKEDRHLKNLK